MPAPDEPMMINWWAEGDTPVHSDSRVAYYVDGRMFMLAFCRHLLRARQYIYLANWGFTPAMKLVRGPDSIAGPDGSPEQTALIAKLRAEGLQEQDIAFWLTHELTVQAVLGYAVSKGVEVKVLLWDAVEFFAHLEPAQVCEQLTQAGITCIVDDSSRGILRHPTESLHQKMSVVDGLDAFVGGIDPLIESTGDFDRWDSQAHIFANPLRRSPSGFISHPWHDVHSHISGPAVADVELNFRQRWNDVVQRRKLENSLLVTAHPSAPPLRSEMLVQVARTIPPETYRFAPTGIQDIAQLYNHAFSNAQSFIYLENQYFWYRAYSGVDVPFLGPDSPDMQRNIQDIAGALRRGAWFAIVLPDHPNVGRAFTDEGLRTLRALAPEANAQGRIQAFCLGTSTRVIEEGQVTQDVSGNTPIMHYRPVYVHAKVALIDDLWSTNGSANLNNRGMRNDAEINVAVLDTRLAHGLRLMLWGEHLGIADETHLFDLGRYLSGQYLTADEQTNALSTWQYLQETIGDAQTAIRLMFQRAWDNLQRYKAGEPLVGHLLPYLTAAQATAQGLHFSEEHGWLEELPS